MSHIRLIGLLLFITAITLALAAAATRTTHLEVGSQWLLLPGVQPDHAATDSSTTIPLNGSTPTDYSQPQLPAGYDPGVPAMDPSTPQPSHTHNWDYAAHQSHFQSTAIPIAWPLLATGVVGLLLWFIQAPRELRGTPKKRSPHRRRR